MNRKLFVCVVPALVVAAACGGRLEDDDDILGASSAAVGSEDKMDRVLAAVLAKGPGEKTPGVAQDSTGGIDVLIDADAVALPKLTALGVNVRTVTSSGIMTARIPLNKVHAAAALAEVRRIEVAKSVRKYMDVSKGPTGLDIPASMRPTGGAPHTGGAGVIVGVLDTGLDFRHEDFKNPDGSTRVRALWDQADYGLSAKPPSTSLNYGHAYNKAAIQSCIDGTGTYCVQRDPDGHGTHVAGTAAGNGRATGGGFPSHKFAGIAPDSELVIVKFDFDGERNTDAAIVDGINWIFAQATAAGKPAVINLSLGSDYGPHDGSTLEERGISDLTGAGKIVVAAAGNPGRASDSPNLALWGHPLHGTGTVTTGSYSEITVDVPAGAAAGDYVFFSIWYKGGNKNQIQVIAPNGASYPGDLTATRPRTWVTGSSYAGYKTTQGTILVGNGGDQLGNGSNNGDNEIYIELSDYSGNPAKVAAGKWKIRIHDRGLATPTSGVYHGWHGSSAKLTLARPWYQGAGTDNTMTVGSPATAKNVISIGAFTTKMAWEYSDLNGTCLTSGPPCCMTYNTGGLSYYDPYYTDTDSNHEFTHTFTPGTCDLASSEPFNNIAFFSARGPSRDGRVQPDIAAPGVGIVASLSNDTYEEEMAAGPTSYFRKSNRIHADGKHVVLQGTSMASPHGTGSVALMLAKNGALTPASARTILAGSARFDASTGGVPNNNWGAGKLDVSQALANVGSAPTCKAVNAVCTASTECCTGNCSGKPGKKICK